MLVILYYLGICFNTVRDTTIKKFLKFQFALKYCYRLQIVRKKVGFLSLGVTCSNKPKGLKCLINFNLPPTESLRYAHIHTSYNIKGTSSQIIKVPNFRYLNADTIYYNLNHHHLSV